MQLRKQYHRELKVEDIKVEEHESGPFYITLNKSNQLIGDRARCLKGYFKKGMKLRALGYDRGNDFIIVDMEFYGGVQVGAKLNTYA